MCEGALVAAEPRVCAGVYVCNGNDICVADKVPGNTDPPLNTMETHEMQSAMLH